MMNHCQQIVPIKEDSELEEKFVCLILFGEWRVEIDFRLYVKERCARIMIANNDAEVCTNLRADRKTDAADFWTAHLLLTDSQIPNAQVADFEVLQHAIAISGWISHFLSLTAEKSATDAQADIEDLCAELSAKLSNGASIFGPCL